MDARQAERAAIKSRCHRGLARIDLSALDFGFSLQRGHREASDKLVCSLERKFELQGCLRFDDENYIPAIIEDNVLRLAISEAGLAELSIRNNDGFIPHLKIPHLDCLHGLHRVLAAERHLDEDERWWTVSLYSKGELWRYICLQLALTFCADLPDSTCREIIEHDPCSQSLSSGAIFRKIRLNRRGGHEQEENTWWARLSPMQEKNFKRLLRKHRLAAAFDDLLDMPGLWPPVHFLGITHKVLAMKCDEVAFFAESQR